MDDLTKDVVVVDDVVDVSEAEAKYAIGFTPKTPANENRIAKISSVTFGDSKAGSPMFTWILTIVDGTDDDGRGEDFKHWTVTNNASFVGFLNALGINRQLTPEFYDEQGKLIRSKFEAEALNRMVKVYTAWSYQIKPDSEYKEATDRTNADYWINLIAKRVYPFDEIGKKFDGELSIVTANTNNDPAPFM